MSASAPPPGRQREQDLAERLAELQAATDDLRGALPFVNNPALHTHAASLAAGAAKLVAAHLESPAGGPDLANDLAGLMSATRALRVPAQDDDLGRTPSLQRLRSAKGLIVAALGDALDAAGALGLHPHQAPLPQDVPVELPRAGNEGLLNGIAGRLDAVVRKLDALDAAKAGPAGFPQQSGLVEYYVGAMRLEIDLARLHLTIATDGSDFSALARAIEVMTDLTGDFVATVRAWVARVSPTLALLAEGTRRQVRRVAAGARAVLAWTARRTRREGAAPEAAWADEAGEDQFGRWASFSVTAADGSQVRQRLRWCPPGRFIMGSPEDEEGRYDTEGPRHEVVFARGFWLFETACRQELWQAVMGDNPSSMKGKLLPVTDVSWKDAMRFVERLNAAKPGLRLALPSEAQWEYACRAGTDTAYSFGPVISRKLVNFGGKATVSVGSLPPNRWGLHEMHGNVWEWCADPWHDNYNGAPADGSAWIDGGAASRVVRGGSWSGVARSVRAAYRGRDVHGNRFDFVGFRCARVQ